MSKLIDLMYQKRMFLLLVFANLFIQLSISYYVMIHTNKSPISHWYLFAIQFLLIILLAMVPMPAFMKFILFSIFSYTFGLSLSRYKEIVDERAIDIAIKGALSFFALMMGAGIALMIGGINLGQRFGAVLFWSLLLLIILRIIFIFGNGLSMTHKGLSGAGIILFSMFIVYDTQKILSRNYAGDFISASMDYYLDIINLFTSLLGYNNDN
jgi:FtsH-binding integral membrane protein